MDVDMTDESRLPLKKWSSERRYYVGKFTPPAPDFAALAAQPDALYLSREPAPNKELDNPFGDRATRGALIVGDRSHEYHPPSTGEVLRERGFLIASPTLQVTFRGKFSAGHADSTYALLVRGRNRMNVPEMHLLPVEDFFDFAKRLSPPSREEHLQMRNTQRNTQRRVTDRLAPTLRREWEDQRAQQGASSLTPASSGGGGAETALRGEGEDADAEGLDYDDMVRSDDDGGDVVVEEEDDGELDEAGVELRQLLEMDEKGTLADFLAGAGRDVQKEREKERVAEGERAWEKERERELEEGRAAKRTKLAAEAADESPFERQIALYLRETLGRKGPMNRNALAKRLQKRFLKQGDEKAASVQAIGRMMRRYLIDENGTCRLIK